MTQVYLDSVDIAAHLVVFVLALISIVLVSILAIRPYLAHTCRVKGSPQIRAFGSIIEVPGLLAVRAISSNLEGFERSPYVQFDAPESIARMIQETLNQPLNLSMRMAHDWEIASYFSGEAGKVYAISSPSLDREIRRSFFGFRLFPYGKELEADLAKLAKVFEYATKRYLEANASAVPGTVQPGQLVDVAC